MKKIALALVLLMIIIVAGCTAKGSKESSINLEEAVQPLVGENIVNTINDAGKEMNEAENALTTAIIGTELANLPRYFDFYDYLDENTLVGLTMNNPFLYDISKQQINVLSNTLYWNMRLSPDKKLIAFNNESGLGILEISTGMESMIYEEIDMVSNNFYVNDFSWSPDSKRLLLREDQELGFKYQLLSLSDGGLVPLVEGLFREVAMVTPDKILFAEVYLSSKKENLYMNEIWREDLLLFDLAGKSFHKLTDVEDLEYFSFITSLGEDIYLQHLTPQGQRLLKMKNNNLEEVFTLDSLILAFKGYDRYIGGRNERFDDGSFNNEIDLFYHSGESVYSLGNWAFNFNYPTVFLFDNSAIVASGKNVPTGQQSFSYEYTAMLYKFN